MVTGVTLPGRQVRPQDQVLVDVVNVGPGYFDAVGVPIVRGRAFALPDIEQRRQVLVVNETMARMLWPGGDALGRRVQVEGHGSEPWEVIGVARNHKVRSVGEPPRPYMHLAEGQSRAIGLVVRTAGPADRCCPPCGRAFSRSSRTLCSPKTPQRRPCPTMTRRSCTHAHQGQP
jgi:hypothetical protein